MSQQESNYDNYQARVVVLKEVKPHPNADRLAMTTIFGSNVIVGLNAKEGDFGIYFIGGTQLSEQFAVKNDLIRRKNPETGENEGGMFDENRRVRTQTLRGQKSDGFFIGMESLTNLGISKDYVSSLREGDSFTILDGIPICNKYEVSVRNSKGNTSAKKSHRKENVSKMFLQHFDTPQVRFIIHELVQDENLDEPIIITEKLHGTSQRVGYVQIVQPLTGIRKLMSKLSGMMKTFNYYKFLIGTRRTVVDNKDGYYPESFRKSASDMFVNKLHKGETIYYEVVGYSGDSPIMGTADNVKAGKEFQKQFGKKTVFSYGNEPGEFSIHVYRITMTNEDGVAIDLPWSSVKIRCEELGVPYVPELDITTMRNLLNSTVDVKELDDSNRITRATYALDRYVDIPTTLGGSHVREGICLRVGDYQRAKVYKHKGFYFKVIEGIIKPSETQQDESITEEM